MRDARLAGDEIEGPGGVGQQRQGQIGGVHDVLSFVVKGSL
jgi:hypothetical protein